MFKNMRLVILFDVLLNPSFKMTTSFANIARTRASTSLFKSSEIFTTFEKIHRSLLNNLKFEETKSQIKAHLSYLANSYFYNYKLSPRILRQYRVLRNLRKNKDLVITKPKGNGVFILDRKIYNNAIEEIISDTSKFKKLSEDPTLKLHYNIFYVT